MINFEDVTKDKIKNHNSKATASWSPLWNINNWMFWIWKNKFFT